MENLDDRNQRLQFYGMFDFENQILYDMCEKARTNTKEEEIIAKLRLIGRSQASALERGAKCERLGDDLYVLSAAPAVRAAGEELDTRIGGLRQHPRITADLSERILETHAFLTGLLHSVTQIHNRSLASKYLHYHAPEIFPIYDSRAYASLQSLNTAFGIKKLELPAEEYDSAYADFISKLIPLMDYIGNEFDVWLNPRELDKLLLLNFENEITDSNILCDIVYALNQ
jgi:hypothetical protein